MYKSHSVAIIVPAYDEENLIGKVMETMPNFVDKIVIVDDCSGDGTKSVIKRYLKDTNRIILLSHESNLGVGAAIVTGYKWAIKNNIRITVVMAGDAQMDPTDLPSILDPVVKGKADYVKGNRLFTGEAWKKIPRIRSLGNSILSLLSKIASGYWYVADFQCGYTGDIR